MSKPSTKPQIRELLLSANPTGLTIRQLCMVTGRPVQGVRNTLHNMPDVYIAAWNRRSSGGPPEAVYRAVEVPLDAPYPCGRRAVREQAVSENQQRQVQEMQEIYEKEQGDGRSKHVAPRFSRI